MSATVPHQEQPMADASDADASTRQRGDSTVEVGQHDGVVVVRPLGQLDRVGVQQVREAARVRAGAPVVIDLDDCILTDPDALAALGHDGDDPTELCFLSRRLTCRVLLGRTGITSRFAVFTTLQDALQARLLAQAGYGHGWQNP